MKDEITNILNEARHAPSILNSQPWQFRVCGNIIEVYLDRQPGLENFDPDERLQIASCGNLIAHLANAIKKYGWVPKINYFPRFEENDLLAYVEITKVSDKEKATAKSGDLNQGRLKNETPAIMPVDSNKPEKDTMAGDEKTAGADLIYDGIKTKTMEVLFLELASLAQKKDTRLIIKEDTDDHKLHNHFKRKYREMLDKEQIKNISLKMFLRSESSTSTTLYEDEAFFSGRFFEIIEEDSNRQQNSPSSRHRFLILMTSSDNRYSWTRSGEVLGDILIHLKNTDMVGLMALPTICKESCRDWLRNELNTKEYPQFVLQIGNIQQIKHNHKRSLQELYKYGL